MNYFELNIDPPGLGLCGFFVASQRGFEPATEILSRAGFFSDFRIRVLFNEGVMPWDAMQGRADRPFRLTRPTAISFSGGRTSAYMLWRTLAANGGLPADALALFANTGKEAEQTLRFVRECSAHWSVPIVWVEFRDNDEGFTVVDFETASRNGEPFEAVIRKRNYLPNPVTRFCTVELKIRAMHRYLRSLGWHEGEGWDQMVGIRADEPRRVAKIRARPSPETVKETMIMPLAEAGVSIHEVERFWQAQPFGLELATHNGRTLAGNCDLCFLKPLAQIVSLAAEAPERPHWWARMEALALSSKPDGARFRKDRPGYAQIGRFAASQRDLFDPAEAPIECFCGD